MRIFLILYPFKFRSFDEKRFEFDLLKKENDVIIFEFIDLIFPHFIKAYKKEKKIKNLFKIKSFFEFVKKLKQIRRKNKEIVVLNFLKTDSFNILLIKIYLKFLFSKKIDIYNPGTPLADFVPKQKNLITFSKIIYKIKINILKIFDKFFNLNSEYVFTSGSENLKKKFLIKYKKIIKGHSWDFSQNLSRKSKRIYKGKYAVYLDAPGPKFLSDSFLFKQKLSETSEHTYPLLKDFFNYIENKMKLDVIIAPHPKTRIKDRSSLFGFRKIIADKTKDLIKNSSLVITRNSTAVEYACYYNKPIILFYTNQLINTEAKEYIEFLANYLNLRAINLDNYKDYELNKIIKFDKNIYKKYLYSYCTTKNLNQPNYKIWSNFNF